MLTVTLPREEDLRGAEVGDESCPLLCWRRPLVVPAHQAIHALVENELVHVRVPTQLLHLFILPAARGHRVFEDERPSGSKLSLASADSNPEKLYSVRPFLIAHRCSSQALQCTEGRARWRDHKQPR